MSTYITHALTFKALRMVRTSNLLGTKMCSMWSSRGSSTAVEYVSICSFNATSFTVCIQRQVLWLSLCTQHTLSPSTTYIWRFVFQTTQKLYNIMNKQIRNVFSFMLKAAAATTTTTHQQMFYSQLPGQSGWAGNGNKLTNHKPHHQHCPFSSTSQVGRNIKTIRYIR